MTSSNVDVNPYILDEPAVKELQTQFDHSAMAIKPARVGYRLLDDYFGIDAIDFLLDLNGRTGGDILSRHDNHIALRLFSNWRSKYYPDYAMKVNYQF